MNVIILLIFFSMLVAGGFLAAFLWAVKSGQFDDQYTPSIRILFENRRIGRSPEDIKKVLPKNAASKEKNRPEEIIV